MKILFLDIETSPHLAWVWSLWDQGVSLDRLVEPGYTLCWAAKFLGDKQIYFSSIADGQTAMIRNMHELMESADAVVTYNGRKFDIPTLHKDFLLQGLAPPAPAKQIDLYRVVKSTFRFASYKLDHVAQQLSLGQKYKHDGFALWLGCMQGDAASWLIMRKYNIKDVTLLEKLYMKLRPWVRSHPNQGLLKDDAKCCPKCGHASFNRRGFFYTTTCMYQRYQCCKCHGWFRGVTNIGPKPRDKMTSL